MTDAEDLSADLPRKYRTLQEGLASLVAYIDDTRKTLGGLQGQLPAASDALTAVGKTTERATHNILGLIEGMITDDEGAAGNLARLSASAEALGQPELSEAVAALNAAAERRTAMLTELMTELSFQDLTTQAINRISKSMLEVERRIHDLLARDEGGATGVTAAAHSGLERLKETQDGQSKQGQIDDLLRQLG
jgi:chemotaxis regulatin CheY-phosphate phosphatase CheZ